MNKVTIDRELLERLAAPLPGDNGWQTWHTIDMVAASLELRAILAAPSAPKADDPVKQMLLEALEELMYAHTDKAEALATAAIAERDATIERLEAGIPRLQEHAHQMRQQRDKLAGLLREVRGYTDSPHIVGIIDAALAEVDD